MERLLITTTLAMALSSTAALAETYHTGLSELNIRDTETGRDLEGFLWYPTHSQEGATTHHTNPVWKGIQAAESAPMAEGRFPFVVLSHGMYGNAMNQTWLASELAMQGYIVAAISHPGTSTWSRDPKITQQLWERPKDISRVIDYALSNAELEAQIDPDMIFMGGHSLGGFTAVALAGGRYDAEGLETFCAAQLERELVCGIFDDWNIAKTDADRMMMEADLSDPRIKAFGVFDLGGTQSFSGESLGQIDTPMIVYGAPKDISGLNLDIESRALASALPASTTTYLEPEGLSHFDFLSECKPAAIEILKEEEPGDEIICQDGQHQRQADHEMIVDTLTSFWASQ